MTEAVPETTTKLVCVTSTNPAKGAAAEATFSRLYGDGFRYSVLSVPSGVRAQPMTDEETLQGALNRVANAAKEVQADYYVAFEGGVEEVADEMRSVAWAVVLGADGRLGKGRAATFTLPPPVADLIRTGHELGEADDIIFGTLESKKGLGAVGLLTDGLIDRAGLYREALTLALIPFLKPELYG